MELRDVLQDERNSGNQGSTRNPLASQPKSTDNVQTTNAAVPTIRPEVPQTSTSNGHASTINTTTTAASSSTVVTSTATTTPSAAITSSAVTTTSVVAAITAPLPSTLGGCVFSDPLPRDHVNRPTLPVINKLKGNTISSPKPDTQRRLNPDQK